MNPRALLLGLLSALCTPAPAHALREVIVGNQPLGSHFGFDPKLLEAVNIEERVFLYNHDGNLYFFFKGGPKALNDTIRRFMAIPTGRREIIILPGLAKPQIFDKKPIAYDWTFNVMLGDRMDRKPVPPDPSATLTIYIPEPPPQPLSPADLQSAKKWLAALGSDDFKTRERAAKELAALGPPVAKLLPVIWAIAQGERPGRKLAPFTMEVMVGPSAVTFKEKVAVRLPTAAVTV